MGWQVETPNEPWGLGIALVHSPALNLKHAGLWRQSEVHKYKERDQLPPHV